MTSLSTSFLIQVGKAFHIALGTLVYWTLQCMVCQMAILRDARNRPDIAQCNTWDRASCWDEQLLTAAGNALARRTPECLVVANVLPS